MKNLSVEINRNAETDYYLKKESTFCLGKQFFVFSLKKE